MGKTYFTSWNFIGTHYQEHIPSAVLGHTIVVFVACWRHGKVKFFGYSWLFICALGVFTEDTVKKEAADLWNQIPEAVQKVYTKELYDNVMRGMLKYSTVDVST